MKETLAFAFVMFGALCALDSCKHASVAATAAESAYTADLLRCVDEAETLSESRACRTKVDERWGIVETVSKDGGR